MGCRFFAWMARITFTGYLVHMMFILVNGFGEMDTGYLGLQEMNYKFITVLILAIFFAILLSLFVELPFMNLQKLVFTQNKKAQKQDILLKSQTGNELIEEAPKFKN